MNDQRELDHGFVKEHYDRQVGGLSTSYTRSRWESSVVGAFDHAQTQRALEHALGQERYQKALEIGPGDAVWTPLLLKRANTVHLVEQSVEMLEQAKQRLAGETRARFERSDFMESQAQGDNDIVMAIRCFEYFVDKPAALRKMYNLLKPGGCLILVTKNASYMTTRSVQAERLHSDQRSRAEMRRMLTAAGFSIQEIYPATWRWKAQYAPFRFFFDVLHRAAVATSGMVRVPLLDTYAVESYLYLVRKPLI